LAAVSRSGSQAGFDRLAPCPNEDLPLVVEALARGFEARDAAEVEVAREPQHARQEREPVDVREDSVRWFS